MGKFIETIINRWDGGMINASRINKKEYSRSIQHFDALTAPDKLLPQRDTAADSINNETVSGSKLVQFFPYTSGTFASGAYTSYQAALGVNSTTNNARFFFRDPPPTTAWTGFAATTFSFSENCCVQYNNKFYIGIDNINATFTLGTHIAEFTPDNPPTLNNGTWNTTANVISFRDVVQGIVFGKNDILYIPYFTDSASNIMKFDNTTWTDTTIPFPADCIPVSVCEYGNYLALATKPRFLGGRSRVFIWDGTSGTYSYVIDWGYEDLQFVEELDGYLVGVSVTGATSIVIQPKLVVKVASLDTQSINDGATPVRELKLTNTTTSFGKNRQKAKNRIYFSFNGEVEGTQRAGIWALGRNSDGKFALYLEQLWNDATTFTSSDLAKGFNFMGDYLTLAYTVSGTYNLRVTANQDFTANAVYESLIYDGNQADPRVSTADPKSCKEVVLTFEPLPSGSSIALAYKVDSDTSWTTIFTESTANTVFHSAVTSIPENYREIQWKITSLGSGVQTESAVPTSLFWREEVLNRVES